MRRAVMFALLAGGLFFGAAEAAAQAPSSTHDVQRAPGGSLRRGWIDVPAWVVWGAGALLAGGAATAVGLRLRRTR